MIRSVELELGGRRLDLVLNWSALSAFERLSGKNSLREWTWTELSATDVLHLLYATANRWTWRNARQVLADEREEISLDWLGEAIRFEDLESLQETLRRLYDVAHPEDDGKEGRADDGSDPQSGSPGGRSGPSRASTSGSPSSTSGT